MSSSLRAFDKRAEFHHHSPPYGEIPTAASLMHLDNSIGNTSSGFAPDELRPDQRQWSGGNGPTTVNRRILTPSTVEHLPEPFPRSLAMTLTASATTQPMAGHVTNSTHWHGIPRNRKMLTTTFDGLDYAARRLSDVVGSGGSGGGSPLLMKDIQSLSQATPQRSPSGTEHHGASAADYYDADNTFYGVAVRPPVRALHIPVAYPPRQYPYPRVEVGDVCDPAALRRAAIVAARELMNVEIARLGAEADACRAVAHEQQRQQQEEEQHKGRGRSTATNHHNAVAALYYPPDIFDRDDPTEESMQHQPHHPSPAGGAPTTTTTTMYQPKPYGSAYAYHSPPSLPLAAAAAATDTPHGDPLGSTLRAHHAATEPATPTGSVADLVDISSPDRRHSFILRPLSMRPDDTATTPGRSVEGDAARAEAAVRADPPRGFDLIAASTIIANAVDVFCKRYTADSTVLPLAPHLHAALQSLVRAEVLRAAVSYGRRPSEPLWFGDGPYRKVHLSPPQHQHHASPQGRTGPLPSTSSSPSSGPGAYPQNQQWRHPAADAVAADYQLDTATVALSSPTVRSDGTVLLVGSINRHVDGARCPPRWVLAQGNASANTVIALEPLLRFGYATCQQIVAAPEHAAFALELRPGAMRTETQYTVWFYPTPSAIKSDVCTFRY